LNVLILGYFVWNKFNSTRLGNVNGFDEFYGSPFITKSVAHNEVCSTESF